MGLRSQNLQLMEYLSQIAMLYKFNTIGENYSYFIKNRPLISIYNIYSNM